MHKLIGGDSLKILSLTNEFAEERFGGAGTAVTGMVHMFDSVGVQQTVIVPRSDWSQPGWIFLGQGIKVLGLPRNSNYFGYLGMVRVDAVRRDFPEINQKWDIIHCHAINFSPLAYSLSQGDIPVLYSVYSFLRKELGNPPQFELQAQFKIQEELLMRSKRIHLISLSERQYLESCFPEYLSKTEVVPLGVTIPFEHWQYGSMNQFLYVGRLLDYKGIEDLISALALVGKRGRKVNLYVVGKGVNLYEEHLTNLLRQLKLERCVHILGRKSDLEVRQWMSCAKGLIVPSRREAYGLVALEGMAVGAPLIVSNVGGLKEVVPKDCALWFEAGNVRQLANALVSIMDNPALQSSLSVKGHQNALKFQWNQLAPRYLKVLNNVLL